MQHHRLHREIAAPDGWEGHHDEYIRHKHWRSEIASME